MNLNPVSLTHQHLFAIVNTLIFEKNTINILDAGCGDGKLIEFLYKKLSIEYPQTVINIHGFDVSNHGVQDEGFISKATHRLLMSCPDISWSDRIQEVEIGENWPYAEGFFDFIISNQVLEHVSDKLLFFSLVEKHLVKDGFFIALNPLNHCFWEGHIYLPFAHRISSHTSLRKYISLCSLIGLGKFPKHHKKSKITRSEYSEKHADYIKFWTSYSSEKETLDIATQAGLRASFLFSLEFYLLKIKQIFKVTYADKYTYNSCNMSNSFLIKILRYLSSVTLVCQKRNIY